MRITESHIRRIVAEEAKKFKRGKRINESRESAEDILTSAMDEYLDQMNAAGFGYEEICASMKEAVNGFCEAFLADLAPEDRDPEYNPNRSTRF
jgi:hypothetical protein